MSKHQLVPSTKEAMPMLKLGGGAVCSIAAVHYAGLMVFTNFLSSTLKTKVQNNIKTAGKTMLVSLSDMQSNLTSDEVKEFNKMLSYVRAGLAGGTAWAAWYFRKELGVDISNGVIAGAAYALAVALGSLSNPADPKKSMAANISLELAGDVQQEQNGRVIFNSYQELQDYIKSVSQPQVVLHGDLQFVTESPENLNGPNIQDAEYVEVSGDDNDEINGETDDRDQLDGDIDLINGEEPEELNGDDDDLDGDED
jgi:hypothetical protein